jgi:hypothetical protein
MSQARRGRSRQLRREPAPPERSDSDPKTFLVWLETTDNERGAAASGRIRAQPARLPPGGDIPRRAVVADPQYEQHLRFLEHHPGFLEALEDVARSPNDETFERLAADWRIEVGDVRHMAEAAALRALRGVRLPPLGARVRVEVHSGELVVRVPFPVSPAARDVIIAWARVPSATPNDGRRVSLSAANRRLGKALTSRPEPWIDSTGMTSGPGACQSTRSLSHYPQQRPASLAKGWFGLRFSRSTER